MATTVQVAANIRPFHVHIPEEKLADLRHRLAGTRWPSPELVTDSSQGVQSKMLPTLANYWEREHNWRKIEKTLNDLPQFSTTIDGVDIHFIHVKSRHEDAMPLLITHGWPGSVIEMLDVIGPTSLGLIEVDQVRIHFPCPTHFAAWEEPEIFARELRAAFSSLR
jgi:hypothetical protein